MSSNRKLANTKRPKLFSPAVVREEAKFSVSAEVSLSPLADTNFESTSSFRYDNPGTGVKSTQEIPLDWSKFENHTFFNSAQSKVNIAFDRIINEYPFDGTEKHLEAFEDSLTGFENHILDIFPKNTGFLLLSGTTTTENPSTGYSPGLGTRIRVNDSAGSQFSNFSKRKDGAAVIDFGSNPFSFEFFLRPPDIVNGRQIVFQKRKSSTLSVNVSLDLSTSTAKADLIFAVSSGSSRLYTSASIEKGRFSHICATYDRGNTNKLLLYVSETLANASSDAYEFGSLSLDRAPFLIGSGSNFFMGDTDFSPQQTLSGALDEIRVFHSVRSIFDQKSKGYKSIYESDDLKLYFKLNEPSGSYNMEDVVLDSSGNSLHSTILNFSTALRNTGSYSNPMTSEDKSRCPILFPSFGSVNSLNSLLLSSASYYDDKNPNLVTKLMPVHYLLEGQASQGLTSQDGQIGNVITADSIPGSAKIGSAQYLTAFLLIWSKFFDEIKIFIDHFSKVIHPSYDDDETVATKFLPFVANYYGIDLPPMFPNVDPMQFISGENIGDSYSRSEKGLSYIQSEIWRRILINLNEIIRSKGTVHSIKSLIRAAGINPDTLVRVREFGGPTKRSLDGLREIKTEVVSALDFSRALLNPAPGDLTPQGFSSNVPNMVSNFLSASRIEVGFPEPAGSFVQKREYYPHGISNNESDGLLTSGSFTYEANYRFPGKRAYPYSAKQSLVRLHVSSSVESIPKGIASTNLIILSGTQNSLTSSGSTLRLYVRPGSTNSGVDPLLKLELEGVNIFDGNIWNISFGRKRHDQVDVTAAKKYFASKVSTAGSSSYFLRCARQTYGDIKQIFSTSSFFKESTAIGASDSRGTNVFENIDGTFNPSGSMIVIGSQSMSNFTGLPYNVLLSDPDLDTRPGGSSGDFSSANTTIFEGQVSQVRFWSKTFDDDMWYEHVRNPKSLGVEDPRVNFNFATKPTGSFERLRVDLSMDQVPSSSDSSGNINLFDFSQNAIYASGSGFVTDSLVIKPETFYFSHLSPKFDMAQTDNKVRVRSFETAKLIDLFSYSTSAPSFDVIRSEEPFDDTRFSIEFSSVRALDEDIMNIFGSLDFFNDAMGRTNLLFDDFYPNIDQARKIYFDRLTEKPDYQVFFNMYKWFNSSLGDLIRQLIPRKTKFLGINFIIESHVLERNKFRYLFDDIYLSALDRDTNRGNLLLSQIVGTIKKM